MISTAALFNDPKYSDLAISLSNGTLLHVHKVVLIQKSQAFAQLIMGPLPSFPTYTDEAIILALAYVYTESILTAETLAYQCNAHPLVWPWIEVSMFLHQHGLDISKLIPVLAFNYSFIENVKLAHKTNNTSLLKATMEYTVDNCKTASKQREILSPLRELDSTTFEWLYKESIAAKHNSHLLVLCVCYHCDPRDMTKFARLIDPIPFDPIARAGLEHLYTHAPIISDMPALQSLVKKIALSRPPMRVKN